MTEYLTRKQLVEIQARTRAPRDSLLIRTQYETGCTVSELVNIHRSDLQKHSIVIKNRECTVSTQLLRDLETYLNRHSNDYVFMSRHQRQLTTKRVQQIIKEVLNELTVAIQKPTPHILRYTHIVHAAKQHIPLPAIMKQTGLAEQRISQILADTLHGESTEYERMFT